MKVRNDYVSNSSSCSFIVKGAEAFKMFYEDFKDSMNDVEPLGETTNVSVYSKKSDGSDAFTWDNRVDFSDFINFLDEGKVKVEDVAGIMFECDDWDTKSVQYLHFLYLYFDKFGFAPDDSDSENQFRDGNTGGFMTKIMKRLSII